MVAFSWDATLRTPPIPPERVPNVWRSARRSLLVLVDSLASSSRRQYMRRRLPVASVGRHSSSLPRHLRSSLFLRSDCFRVGRSPTFCPPRSRQRHSKMFEYFSGTRWLQRGALRLGLVLLIATSVTVAACTESFDGGSACPSLCPAKPNTFRDTTIEAVVLDTSLSGFPSLGLSPTVLIATRPDTLVTRGVIRFDILPTSFNPNGGSTFTEISAIDSVYLRLPLDSTGRLGTLPVTLSVFDVDTTVNDSVSSVVNGLFRADRRVGSVTFIPSLVGDSLRIPLSPSALLAKITKSSRFRVGLQITGGTGQLRAVAFVNGAGAPSLVFEPTSDTTIAPMTVAPNTSFADATSDVQLAYQVYGLVNVGSKPPDATTLIVGGYPAYRSYLRFALPVRISDSSTIVRAEVLLTQRRSSFGNVGDTVIIVPLVPTSTTVVSDLRRILDLSADGSFASLDSTRLVPRDSGLRVLNVLNLVRSWPALSTTVPRALAFRINNEGAQPAELRFFSSEAASSLRPRLRITYLPRSEFAIP